MPIISKLRRPPPPLVRDQPGPWIQYGGSLCFFMMEQLRDGKDISPDDLGRLAVALVSISPSGRYDPGELVLAASTDRIRDALADIVWCLDTAARCLSGAITMADLAEARRVLRRACRKAWSLISLDWDESLPRAWLAGDWKRFLRQQG
jgi:hypothetical protein